MNDNDLINQIINGNANAYEFLVCKYQRLVFSIALKMIGSNQVEAEDIAQDTFIKVYKNIKRFRGESKLSTWIASIAWKTSVDYVRKKKRTKIDFTDSLEMFDFLSVDGIDIKTTLNEIQELVQHTIEKLPPQYKTMMCLYYIEEFSYPEIEKITNVPLGTIKSYLNRARKVFRVLVESEYGNNVSELLNNN